MGREKEAPVIFRNGLFSSGYSIAQPYTPPGGHDTGLFRVDRPGVAWDWMAQAGQSPSRSDWVRPQVAEAWHRCIETYHLVPGARVSMGVPADIEHLRHLGEIASAGARTALANIAFSLQSLLRNTSVALLVADPSATLINVMEAGLALGPAGRWLVALGAKWQESTLGNNGLGTAAVLREAVAFDGKEHFAKELHPYATVGQPILNSTGGVAAILGLITDRRDSASALLCLVRLAGHLIEANLFEQLGPGGCTLRLSPAGTNSGLAIEDCLLDGLIAVDKKGKVSGATRGALDLLGHQLHAEVIGKPMKEILGISLRDLFREACPDGTASELTAPNNRLLTLKLFGGCRFSRACGFYARPSETAHSPGDGAAPSAGAGRRPFKDGGQWRDTVHEAALQKGIAAKKQKIAVLITGESGVGKDHLVRLMHEAGPRQGRPLVQINCAAIPRELISTELFGYEAGSFTGARVKGKAGKFAEAHTGTIFLDEIGDMALDLQVALLCVLDNSEIVPVGGSAPLKVDVQVVAATNAQLQECVRKGSFRRDLYYRLNGAQITLPPLRERPDKMGLISHLWDEEARLQNRSGEAYLSDEVLEIFEQHPWPGNIRELRNVLKSSMAGMTGPELKVFELPHDFIEEMNYGAALSAAAGLPEARLVQTAGEAIFSGALSESEERTIRSSLAATQGNITKSAKQLGITRATLYSKMARYGLRK
jgi:sigma-54 dependent transcriptional regulator, acetoin dehydrogenase operon transcriptional activator AcoR